MKISRIGSLIRDGWVMVGVALLLFGVAEFALSRLFRRLDNPGGADHRLAADIYRDAPWVAEYFREDAEAAVLQWHPYVYWRLRPYHGKYVNVDQDAIRATIPSVEQPAATDTVKVFMLGGSTMWGNGVPDRLTIPSALASELRERGVACNVTNFGENGYVSTQEVITLMLQLRGGHVPDLAIFYDGINDTYSAWQQGVAGLPQNEANRVKEFNLSSPRQRRHSVGVLVQDSARELATVRFALTVAQRIGLGGKPGPAARRPGADDSALAESVVNNYLGNLELVRALGERYGFQCLFYWQPNLFEKSRPTPYEAGRREVLASAEPFFHATYAALRKRELEKTESSFHDVSALFANTEEPIYLDCWHLGEAGNRAVARDMADDVMRVLASRK